MQGQWLGEWPGRWLGNGSASGGGGPVVLATLAVVGRGSAFMAPNLWPATTLLIAGLTAAGSGSALVGAQLLSGEPPITPRAAPSGFATGGGPGAHITLSEWRRLHSPAARHRGTRRRQESDRVLLGLL